MIPSPSFAKMHRKSEKKASSRSPNKVKKADFSQNVDMYETHSQPLFMKIDDLIDFKLLFKKILIRLSVRIY